MTHPQLLSIATLLAMMAIFIWGRFRYDVTAIKHCWLRLHLASTQDAFQGLPTIS